MTILLLILGLIMFVALVVLHEWGHFIAARRNGVVVEEFGIGFPPRAWKRKTKKGFIFSLNWLPIGGFVKLKGENDAADEPGSFGAAAFSTKTKIMLAGVSVNLVIAFLIFTGLALTGMPQLLENQFTVARDTKVVSSAIFIGHVDPGSPADKGGLRDNDRIVSIQGPGITYYDKDGKQALYQEMGPPIVINSIDKLTSTAKKYAGSNVKVTVERGDGKKTFDVRLRTVQEAKDKAFFGVSSLADLTVTRSTWSAPVQAVGLIGQITKATFVGIGTALSALFHGQGHKASEQVSGPVGIYAVLKQGSALGIQYVLLIIGIISLSLAIMNVLPIPALDGGRFYVLLLSRLFGKKLSKDTEERIIGASFVFLLALIIIITIVDVNRFF